MENQYGITVTNKFNLFLDENDEDLLNIVQQRQESQKLAKGEKTKNKSSGVQSGANNENDPKAVKNKQNKDKSATTAHVTAAEPNVISEKIDNFVSPPKKDGNRLRRMLKGLIIRLFNNDAQK